MTLPLTQPPAPEVVGRYAIYDKIAVGGMASVYLGRLMGGAGFARTVAIKRPHPHLADDPEFLSTMIDEARLAARIHHPNVVPTLDVIADGGVLLLVMEYVRGESLARLARVDSVRGRGVPLPIAIAIAIDALHGLHAAHEARSDHGTPLGIVHRDVSPQNILVGTDGMARVIDFGVARAIGRLQTTREGTLKGKMAYMAPEHLNGRELTRSADIYAMGVVLWEILTGRRLFQEENEAALVKKVLAGPADPPSRYAPGVPPGLDALVMRALAEDPAARFDTAMDMAERMTELVPPARPIEVGKWCSEAARESLARREMLVAKIESGSAAVPVMPAMPAAIDSEEMQLEVDRAAAPSRGDALGRRPSSGPTRINPVLLEPVPAAASQESSLSIETPMRIARSDSRSRRLIQASLACGGVLAAIGIAMVLHGKKATDTPEGARAAATSPALSSSALPPPTQATTDVPSAEPPVPQVASAFQTTGPANSASVHVPRAPAGTRRSSPASPPEAAKPKVSCNPPFEFDSRGMKIWKRQCM